MNKRIAKKLGAYPTGSGGVSSTPYTKAQWQDAHRVRQVSLRRWFDSADRIKWVTPVRPHTFRSKWEPGRAGGYYYGKVQQ